MRFRKPAWLPEEITDQEWHDFNISLMITLGICLAALLLFANSMQYEPWPMV